MRLVTLTVAAVFILGPIVWLRADVFVLKNNGRVEGTLVNPKESPRKSFVVKTDDGVEITIDPAQVKSVIMQSSEEREYEKIRFSYADTVQEQWKLAEWCREKGLSRERATHLERIIELDPNHKQARAGLGYGQINGRWVRQQDVMKERGFVLYKGRWLLPQDVEIQEQKAKAEAAQMEWRKKLRRLQANLEEDGPRGKAALEELRAISDPNAVPAIVDALKNDNDEEVAELFLGALARIASPEAIRVLAEVALAGRTESARDLAIDYLKKLESPVAVSHFVQALKSKSNAEINRAGVALGELGDKTAIGPLIGALVTTHKEKVVQGNASGNTYSPSFDSSGSFSFGAGSKTVTVKRNYSNRGVHDALVKLSDGQDFGFETKAWQLWHNSQRKQPAKAGRRD